MCDEDLDEEQIYEAGEYLSHKSNNLHRKLSHRLSVSEQEQKLKEPFLSQE